MTSNIQIDKEKKGQVTKEYQLHEKDTGSTDVQVALLTERINNLAKHMQSNQKDLHSRQGLLRMVGQRRRLLDYLSDKDYDRYKNLIKRLNIRK